MPLAKNRVFTEDDYYNLPENVRAELIEGNLIYPHVVGGSVGLPSIWVLAAVTIGGNLMGIVGMLIFIPLVSVLYTIFREFVYLRLKEKNIKQVTKTVVEEYTAEEIAAMGKNIKKNRE